MAIEKFHDHAAAEYYCNVNEFINNGEGKKLTRLQNLLIRTKYPKVEKWHYNMLTLFVLYYILRNYYVTF